MVIQIVCVKEFPSPGPEWVTPAMLVIPQSCPTFCSPKDCNPPDSSDHGILQARILEWIALPFSRGSSWPRYQTWVSYNISQYGTENTEMSIAWTSVSRTYSLVEKASSCHWLVLLVSWIILTFLAKPLYFNKLCKSESLELSQE